MTSLPQHDPSPTRATELEQRRARYRWDHEYLAPFPFLHVPYVSDTGVLAIYDVLAGSFAGLPEEERPTSEWLIRKTLGAGPAIYELLERVPRTHWVGLAEQIRALSRERGPEWIKHAVRQLLPRPGQRRLLRVMLPNVEQLATSLTELLLRSTDELSTWVLAEGTESQLSRAFDDYASRASHDEGGLRLPGPEDIKEVVQGFVRGSVGAVVSSARDHARRLVSGDAQPGEPTLPPAPGRAADPWLPPEVKRIVAPAELLVRFMARMRRFAPCGGRGKPGDDPPSSRRRARHPCRVRGAQRSSAGGPRRARGWP
ncbi:MAG: hypothetical protein K0V04_27080 [Deltaproteobacteria bacterium]|nr:hypothetical protein [Deltaproteobacteria bacterium]